jgi:hypothetical protein
MKMRAEIKAAMLALKAEIVEGHSPCNGRGWLEPEKPGQLNPCSCMVVFHYLIALIEAKIPRNYWWIGIDDLEIDEEYRKFCHWFNKRMAKAVEHGLGVLFFGANGTGKTSMQCAIGKEAVVLGYNVQYFTAQQYIESRKADNDILTKEYESGEIILLDELDKVYIKSKSNYVTKTLEDFLRRKSTDGASFIICTNHNEETLKDVFGQSTISMLRRHLKFVDVEGEDYSKKLQNTWDSLMESKTNYYADQIVSMGKRLIDRELEEDERDWQETYRRSRA